ncbi:putative dual specificity protein phosphatase DSP8 [Morella rubra]|uniref:phosphatidylglycerophosphatase n=1 Tax=Morella rubra TaxID=262757 RepID=A0A6A1V8R8_9ROSI|nr:putative dual specificity protein phosphatase DSP8 [Morella rubra]
MKIEELDDAESVRDDDVSGRQIVRVDAKRALVGAGARILFYPTLLYNVLRNKMEAEFRWWDEVDQFLLLGAVPFPKDVPRLKQLGVGGVITLNEPYETLVPTSLYHAHEIDHLVIPTRDYLFAPSFVDINRAVDFIHLNTFRGKTTYVHCKAGRGRSTTIVLCYLVRYKHMTPVDALEYVRSRRPRVLLAPSQWKAVQEYSKGQPSTRSCSPSGDAVLITKADLEGYHGNYEGDASKHLQVVPKAVKARPMIARLSCLFASLRVSGGCGSDPRRLQSEQFSLSRQKNHAEICGGGGGVVRTRKWLSLPAPVDL